MKVLHLPTTVGGNPQRLSHAERKIGLDSSSLAFHQNFFQFSADTVLFKQNQFFRNEIKRWFLIINELKEHDVVHYNFGLFASPFRKFHLTNQRSGWRRRLYNLFYGWPFEGADLKLLERSPTVIAVTYQGDDARQGDYCRANYPIHHVHEVEAGYYSDYSDSLKRERIARFDRYAHLMYALNPDLLNVLPQRCRFLPYAAVDLEEWEFIGVSENDDVPHLIHAPSDRSIKGTKYVEDAVERLRSEGVRVRFTLVEGMSNDEAKKIYQDADLLVDQLLAGWYGGLAVELMALGKPVVCYLRQKDLVHVPREMCDDMPVIDATPKSIYEVLKDWLTNRRQELRQRGVESRKYVEKWHDPLKIAAGLKKDYQTAHARIASEA